jgi:hypothetical protein
MRPSFSLLTALIIAAGTCLCQPKYPVVSVYDSTTTVNVTTVPASARLYVDSVFVGLTPLVIDTLGHRRTWFRIEKKDYHLREFWVKVPTDTSAGSLHLVLRSSVGFLSIVSARDTFACMIDDTLYVTGPFRGLKLSEGWHRLLLRQQCTGRNFSTIVAVPSARDTVFETRFGYTTLMPVLWSAIIPGVAAFHDDAVWESAVFCAGTTGFAAAAILLDRSMKRRSGAFDTEYAKYLAALSENEAVRLKQSSKTAFDEREVMRTPRAVAIGMFAAFYLGTLVDAILEHAHDDELVPLNKATRSPLSISVQPTIDDRSFSLHLDVTF